MSKNLYTKEQRDYVDSIDDKDLRTHLLHQVRLRDNMEKDRNAFEKENNEILKKYRDLNDYIEGCLV